MILKKITFLYLFVFFISSQIGAQIKNQITEKESQLQNKFIEANIEFLLARYDKAEKLLIEAIKENEAIGAFHFELGKVYETKGEDQKALGSYNRAISLEKNNKWYYIQKLNLLLKGNSYSEAAGVCEQLTQIDQINPEHFYNWAIYALQSHNPQYALTALDKLEAKQGLNLKIAENKINIFQNLGQQDKAIAILDKLIAGTPSCVPCLTLQASYFAELNKPEEATKVWRKILELDPSNTDAKIAVAAGMKIAGDDLGFLHSLKPLFVNKNVAYDKKMKEIIPYIQKLAVTHDQKLGSALTEALQMLNETNPGNAKTYAAMADVAQNTGQIKDAVQYYKKSLSLDKSIFSVWEQLMYLLDQIRDYPSLLSTSNDLLDLYPALAVANYWNAYSFVKNDKPDEALESANIGISAAKNNQAIQYKLHIVNGMAYSLKKDTNKSKESFKLAQELNPKIDWAYLAEARELAKTPGNLQQALSLVEQALKLNPESFEAWATKAFILSQNNDFEKAKDLYAQSISKGGSDYAQILEEYGDVLFKLNDKESALKYWKSAVDKGIELPQLRKKIEDVKP